MNKFYTFLAIVGLTITSNAQTTLGMRGGANLATVNMSDEFDIDTKYRFGATGGIFVNIPVNQNFSIQPELLYSGQGYQYDFKEPVGNYLWDVKTTIKSDYLTLPIFVKYKFKNGLTLELGPQISYLLEGQINQIIEEKSGNDVVNTSSVRMYLNDYELANKLDYSGVVGVGYEMKGGYSINARYTHGFRDFFGYGEDLKNTNSYFSLTVGIPFLK